MATKNDEATIWKVVSMVRVWIVADCGMIALGRFMLIMGKRAQRVELQHRLSPTSIRD